eukprot:CCRYP_016099-RA/>CCRYP_016099-RA protein AED:0.38 eAED:0.38 QI:0/-1/0/1/-1/1/1/0/104
MPVSVQDDIQSDVILGLDDDAVPTKTDSRSSETQKKMYGPNGAGFKLATRDMTQEIKAILNKLKNSQSPENSDLIQGLGINAVGLPENLLSYSTSLRSSTPRTA